MNDVNLLREIATVDAVLPKKNKGKLTIFFFFILDEVKFPKILFENILQVLLSFLASKP